MSHSGPSARGEFAYSLNLTDIYSGWCESRAVLGRGQEAVLAALKDIQASLPFPILAVHSDNGSEFINHAALQERRQRPHRTEELDPRPPHLGLGPPRQSGGGPGNE